MKRFIFVILFLVAVSTAQADVVMNGLTPYGAVQSGNSCWAAADGGMLFATDWALQATPQDTYRDIANHLGYGIGSSWYGASWYFSTYYPDVQQSDVLHQGYGLSSIVYDINQGWATVVDVFPQSGVGHSLQVYGYQEDAGIIDGFYYINSWGNESLQYSPVVNGSWFYNTGYIGNITGLVPEDAYVPSPPPPPPVIPPSIAEPNQVPEPSIAWLLGLGLIVMVTVNSVSCLKL